MTEDTYNGWTNYETWCVHLWLTNDEGTYRHCRALAAECRDDAPDDPRVADGIWPQPDAAKFLLADRLQEFLEDQNPLAEEEATVFSDLLNAALSDVDWHEIAEAFLEE